MRLLARYACVPLGAFEVLEDERVGWDRPLLFYEPTLDVFNSWTAFRGYLLPQLIGVLDVMCSTELVECRPMRSVPEGRILVCECIALIEKSFGVIPHLALSVSKSGMRAKRPVYFERTPVLVATKQTTHSTVVGRPTLCVACQLCLEISGVAKIQPNRFYFIFLELPTLCAA